MKKINVAVIGTGVMGKNHARIYSEMDNASLIAVCDTNEESAKSIAEKYKTKHYTDYNLMLGKEKIDAVSICVPTKMHKQVAIDVISKGIHVLVEKPISKTVEEAKDIIKAAEKNKVKLMVGHIERFNPAVIELKKRIENNELGKILEINCERLSLFPQRIIDVGVVIDLAIHEIDILRYIVNKKIKRVYAETAQRFHASHEDLLLGTIRFENDILGVINSNWLSPKKVREIKVTGEKGMFISDYITQELYFQEKEFAEKEVDYNKGFINGREGKKIKIDVASSEPLKNELHAFIDCIRDNTGPKVTGEDGLAALDIAQKFLESAKKNEVINL
jgi:UDP-N-acetylglucosamine 3-dehydrogenase